MFGISLLDMKEKDEYVIDIQSTLILLENLDGLIQNMQCSMLFKRCRSAPLVIAHTVPSETILPARPIQLFFCCRLRSNVEYEKRD